MRVLLTINCRGVDASAAGGMTLGRMLSRRGHVVLVQTAPGGDVGRACSDAGMDTAGPNLKGSALATGAVQFARLVRRFAPDVICATRADGQTAAALLFPGIPVVRIRCDIRRPAKGKLWRFVDRRTDLVVLPSRFMLRRGYAGGRTGPLAVIPHPVDTDRFRPFDRPAGALPGMLLAIGRLSPVKGHRTIVRALTLLPGIRATIAGPPSQQTPEELMSYASELGVADRLILTGRKVDVRPLYERGGIGVVTSLGSEVVSRAGMEMMSAGLPLLAASTNGLLDLVTDGETGLFHSPGDHRQLAAQATFLFANPSVAETLSRRARRFCIEKLDEKIVAPTWEEVLLALIHGEQHPVMRVPPLRGIEPESW